MAKNSKAGYPQQPLLSKAKLSRADRLDLIMKLRELAQAESTQRYMGPYEQKAYGMDPDRSGQPMWDPSTDEMLQDYNFHPAALNRDNSTLYGTPSNDPQRVPTIDTSIYSPEDQAQIKRLQELAQQQAIRARNKR